LHANHQADLAKKLIDSLDQQIDEEEAIVQALAHPKSGTSRTKTDRRIILDRFSCEIICESSENRVTITAVWQPKRKSVYWNSRK